uniref:Methylmalonic aciduria and homocystinuria type D protein, mitochondrial n=1 Tax=Panagrolaimus sp. JU765 TaxID=591449 RepID=A0AC34QFF9_9BILA
MSLSSTARVGVCRANVSNIRSNNKFSTMARVSQQPIIFVENTAQRRTNQLLGPNKKFPLPGDVAIATPFPTIPLEEKTIESVQEEKMSEPAFKTVSIEQLLNASMNVKKAADYVPAPVIDRLKSDANVELKGVACPRLLKKDLKYLFVDVDFADKNVTVLNLTQKSASDMASWSPDMEIERMKLTSSFIDSATAICQALKECGYWADFIDPSSGRPYLGKFTNSCLFETDERYRQLGFQIEDLGCCQVLKHIKWGTHAFVGTIFTDAPLECDFVKTIMQSVNVDKAC